MTILNNVTDIHMYKRAKYLKDNILACEAVLKDIDVASKVLLKHQHLTLVKNLLLSIKDSHDNLFRFTIKQNNELKKIQESEN